MGRRGNRDRDSQQPATNWESERTLASAEEEAAERESFDASADTACPCGNREVLLEAYLRVVDGKLDPEPLEVETLTCPECGREFEAVQAEGGRVLRGDFLGHAEMDDE
jgi:hypothetical protein